MTSAATFNTMISSRWLKEHSQTRFDPHFGVVGGEDMVFFRAARAAGLSIRFSERGFVYENEPADRTTFAYQLYVYFWHGNSAALSCVQSGMPHWRMFVHGLASLGGVQVTAGAGASAWSRERRRSCDLPLPKCCTRPASCSVPSAFG